MLSRFLSLPFMSSPHFERSDWIWPHFALIKWTKLNQVGIEINFYFLPQLKESSLLYVCFEGKRRIKGANLTHRQTNMVDYKAHLNDRSKCSNKFFAFYKAYSYLNCKFTAPLPIQPFLSRLNFCERGEWDFHSIFAPTTNRIAPPPNERNTASPLKMEKRETSLVTILLWARNNQFSPNHWSKSKAHTSRLQWKATPKSAAWLAAWLKAVQIQLRLLERWSSENRKSRLRWFVCTRLVLISLLSLILPFHS